MNDPSTTPTTVSAMWPMFHALEWGTVKDCDYAVAELDRDTEDFAHLIGQEVIIDGALYRCRGVVRFAHCPPWRRGARIGLMVERLT